VDVTIRKGETIKELQGYVRIVKDDDDGRC